MLSCERCLVQLDVLLRSQRWVAVKAWRFFTCARDSEESAVWRGIFSIEQALFFVEHAFMHATNRMVHLKSYYTLLLALC